MNKEHKWNATKHEYEEWAWAKYVHVKAKISISYNDHLLSSSEVLTQISIWDRGSYEFWYETGEFLSLSCTTVTISIVH